MFENVPKVTTPEKARLARHDKGKENYASLLRDPFEVIFRYGTQFFRGLPRALRGCFRGR